MESERLDKAILVVMNLQDDKAANRLKKESAASVMAEAAKKLGGANSRNPWTAATRTESLGSQFKVVEVQYNPKTLQLTTSGGQTSMVNPQAGQTPGSLKQNVIPEETQLSVDLVVEGDKVKKMVNGFMGMMSTALTRMVVFYWGNISFYGEVVRLNTSYTMFDSTGNPIRGSIEVAIRRQNDASQSSYWEKAFSSLFKERSSALADTRKDR